MVNLMLVVNVRPVLREHLALQELLPAPIALRIRHLPLAPARARTALMAIPLTPYEFPLFATEIDP